MKRPNGSMVNRKIFKCRTKTFYILLLTILLLQLVLLFFVTNNSRQLEQLNKVDGNNYHIGEGRHQDVIDSQIISEQRTGARRQAVDHHKDSDENTMTVNEIQTTVAYPQRERVNVSEEEINSFPWTLETKLKVLRYLEPMLFSDELGLESDSVCPIPQVPPPAGLCRNIKWDCNFSPTFVYHDRQTRKLFVNCSGDFRVNFIDREESEVPKANGKFAKDPEWQSYNGIQTIDFNTQYADVECKMEENGRVVSSPHNYRTQFIPNNRSIDQKTLFKKMKSKETDWEPISVLSISLDSLSRAHFHRKCGIPKTAKFIRKLFYASKYDNTTDGDNDSHGPSHQAFLFNRVNSISGITAMNLYPLYAGEYFSRIDEEERVLRHALVKPVNEWLWQYANKRGYLTSYGIDTGNGLMGTRTTCKDCTNRPGVLPHFEHLWVARENSPVGVTRNGEVLSGLCEGDSMLHDYVINYTRDFLDHDYPAKWAAFDLNAQHRSEHESINQVDDSIVQFLDTVTKKHRNLIIFLFGDHGQIYAGEAGKHLGSHLEVLLPFLSIIVPRHVIRSHPEWERNLILNSRRYVVFYDVHKTMKSLLHYPNLHDVRGHLHNASYNLFTDIIPRNRSCASAGIPSWSCACNMPQVLLSNKWTEDHYRFVNNAIQEINNKHSKTILLEEDPNRRNTSTTCKDIHLEMITNVVAYKHGENPKGEEMNQFKITFTAYEGPSTWQLMVDSQGIINTIKQTSRYQKYDFCQDSRVSIEYCICNQFPPGTP